MVNKSIFIDDKTNQLLNNVLAETSLKSKSGLLIGTIDRANDYIYHIVSTPQNREETGASKDDLDSSWIIDHALQIHDMLLGGSDILGLYFVDVPATNCKQVLIKLFKELNKFDYYKKIKFNSERLLFLVDSSNKSINMKALDVSSESAKSAFITCEITAKANLLNDQFFKLTSNFNLNSTFKTPNVKSHNKEDFYSALSTEEMFNENKFVCLINDCYVDSSKPFMDLKAFIDNQKAETPEFNINKYEYYASLMENLSENKSVDDKTKNKQNLDSIYELTGVCNLAVIFHKSMTIEYLKNLLIYDLIRSLHARIRLLVEDLDAPKDIIGDAQVEDPDSNDASAIEESYQTPNRIHIYLDQNDGSELNFFISDYVFPDETSEDISERIKELFDYDIVDPVNQIVFVEDLPPEIKRSGSEDLKKLSDLSDNANSFSSNSSNSSANKNANGMLSNSALYLSAFGIGIMAVFFAYYSLLASTYINEDIQE